MFQRKPPPFLEIPVAAHLAEYLTSSKGIAVEHGCRITERTAAGARIALLEIDTDSLSKRVRCADEDYLEWEWNSDFMYWMPEKTKRNTRSHNNG